ncbi:hypothetical protein BGW37DRAFT_232993 [Umbelopsis sp. PMI_123]|nr:hypothetical protein BGW37DRAFT_232993 [Umbelopsis sp. PMI_123]
MRVYPLASAQGHRAHTSVMQVAKNSTILVRSDNITANGVHQQAGWHSVPVARSVSDIVLGNVPQEGLLLPARHIPGCLKCKFQGSHNSQAAADTLLEHFIANTSSNRTYTRTHHLFIAWCLDQSVDIGYFTTPQLVNFLVDVHSACYSINSIQVCKSVIMQLHLDQDSLEDDTDVRTLIKTFKKHGPPLSLCQS